MGDYIIELKNISKCYEGDTAAVDNVSLSIAKGEFVTLYQVRPGVARRRSCE